MAEVAQPSAEQISNLRAEVVKENDGSSSVDANFELDDACCSRYLRARGLDHGKAKTMLLDTIKWRREFGVAKIVEEHFETLAFECCPGKFFISPFFDNGGRPIMVMRIRLENSQSHEGNILNLVYQLERGCGATRAAGVEKWTLIIDFNGYSMTNAPPLKTSRTTLSIMQDHYPERLHRCFMLDAPRLFSGAWAAISPFIDRVTSAKICFISGPMEQGSRRAKLLQESFELSSLEACIGGTAQWTYSAEEYLQDDRARHEAAKGAQPKELSGVSEKDATAEVAGA
mmetsp:Transcript_102766/g.268253  ORF Transcript_102766/g.268253 Transcript_102766/m.268253 type:complete len:286 (-) Transcript_102766:32-889(-)